MALELIERGCPNCAGPVTDERLSLGLPCERCLPQPVEEKALCKTLKKEKKLKNLKPFCEAEEKLKKFVKLFKKGVGAEPWSLQKVWAKRVFLGESFAVVAPTGVGKTTFGLLTGLFLKPKVLMIFPTRLLAQQAEEKLRELQRKLGTQKKVLLYKSTQGVKRRFLEGDWDLLLGTNMFLHRNFEHLMNFKFSFIFIDDIDSFLKQGKNVENLFKLMGFTDKEIALAMKENKTEEDYEKLSRIRKKKRDTVLVVSSATLKPRGKRAQLFRNLLGFDIQKAITTLRNIVDVAEPVSSLEESLERSAQLIKKLGKGGLVYLSVFYGKEKVQEVKEFYLKRGIKAISYLDYKPEELIKVLETGDWEVAVGISHISNPLVRGIDLPHVIRYALFLDPPKHVFSTELSLSPAQLHSLLLTLFSLFEEEERLKVMQYVTYLKRYLTLREELLDKYPRVKERVLEIKSFLEGKLKDPDFLERIKKSDEVSLVAEGDKLYLVVGDANAYIQASGRTSRFIAGGMTKGLSVVFYADPKAFSSLKKRLQLYYKEIEFKRLKEIDLPKLLKDIDEDRKRARALLEGKIPPKIKDLFKTTLVVVESPNKAKTIAGFFGKPQLRLVEDSVAYEVPLGDRLLVITASLGHVLDLVTDKGFFGVIDDGEPYLPVYDTIKLCKTTREQHTELEYLKNRCEGKIEDKMDILKGIQKTGYEVQEVFIATDPDAEGEKIGYDLFLFTRPFNLTVKRAEFHEVTPRAFKEALEEPREVDLNLVKAQLVRRILDRWVGFTLSRILWQVFGKRWLSAGRVQTPVLGWVIERYELSRQKKGQILLRIKDYPLKIEVEDLALARKVFEELEKALLSLADPSEEEKNPLPPFTTDAVLEEANEKLRLSAQDAMKLLQELFEGGYITYHRTDSTRVSEAGRYGVAKPYVTQKFGEEFFYPRSWGEGGAHECIRPTRPTEPKDLQLLVSAGVAQFSQPRKALALYELIFKRFMASQMRPAKVETSLFLLELPFFRWEERVVTEVLEHGFDTSSFPPSASFPKSWKLPKKSSGRCPKSPPTPRGRSYKR